MFTFLASKDRVQRDKQELYALQLLYGDNAAAILEACVNDDTLSDRDRKH
jgi:hypothetical protein